LRRELEALIAREGADTIAAFIGEPVLGTGGIVPPPAGYWERSRRCWKHDILLIADEVVTGFGRLGSMFGSEHYGLKPDIITIAKGLTSAYAPLSGSIVSDKMWRCWSAAPTRTASSAMAGPIPPTRSGRRPASPTSKLIDSLGLVDNAARPAPT
jgi:L-2,4-diaminobutyrate transaminase